MYRLFFIFSILLPLTVPGQVKTIGIPQIQNYLKSEYKATTQNWAIDQDTNGFMYFANNDGVLRFDGMHWDLFEVAKASPVRTVCVDSKDRIFVGLFNDFGILQEHDNGSYLFQSLRNLLPDPEINFDDVWRIHEIPEGIVFQAFEYVFIYRNNAIKVIEPVDQFHFSFKVNDRLFLHEPGVGLFEYINGNVNRVPWAGEVKDMEIWAMLYRGGNHLLIGTSRHGIYEFKDGKLEKWQTPANDFVENYKLFSAVEIAGNNFAFGTITNGVIVCNSDGDILQHINRNQGLQNNTVLSMFTDNRDNLWLGLDNGIDYIEINSPVTFIAKYKGLGTGYSARIFNDFMYIGTNQGLFVKPFAPFSHTEENFELVEGTTGQVWSLDVFDEQLICGHNLGTFVISGTEAEQISAEEGGWTFIQPNAGPELLIGGHYTGLQLFANENGKWQYVKNIYGFDESSRYIVQDNDGIIWISHGGKGVYKLLLSSDLDSVRNFTLFNSSDGLPSDEQNIVFKFEGKAFISTIKGIYEYNKDNDEFIYSDALNRIFEFQGRLKTLKVDEAGNVWFIADHESGVFRLNEDLTYTKLTDPFKQLDDNYVNEFEFIYPYNSENVILGLDNGFAHYTSKFPKSYAQPFQSFITKVEIPYLDSTLILPELEDHTSYQFPFGKNSFRFHYTAPFYENQEQIKFSFMLENYEDNWSDWTFNSYKDFTNLTEGRYTFKLKAENLYGVESSISEFGFEVLPPWYRSDYAYYVYILVFILFTWMIVRFILYRLNLAKKKQAEKHVAELKEKEERFQHQSLIAEKEIVRLRNEKLHAEMIHRDKELANQTMGIIKKNKFLVKLKEELHRAQKNTTDGELKTRLATINRRINKEIDNEQQNRIFETYFDEVHDDYFERLKQKYSDLSPREMRLSAYIRMNLTSKEIAVLLNISERGVEISRYRLRKKLNISRETNLSTYLSNI